MLSIVREYTIFRSNMKLMSRYSRYAWVDEMAFSCTVISLKGYLLTGKQ